MGLSLARRQQSLFICKSFLSENCSKIYTSVFFFEDSQTITVSTVSYIHWRGVPQGPGRGLRPRPGSLRYTPTVNVGKLFSHAPRMAQITAAVTAAAAAAVVSFRYFPPKREIPGLNFPARRLPRNYRQIHPGW